MTFTQEDMMQ